MQHPCLAGYPGGPPGFFLESPQTRHGSTTSRASEQSEEWFGDDPLLPQSAGVSDSDVDSVLFLTGTHRYDKLFCESEDDVAAQLDRRWRSLNFTASTSRNASRQIGQGPVSDGDVDQPTELILQLDKFGSGWGEELFPRASFVQRPIEKKTRIRPRSSLPDPWTASLRPARRGRPARARVATGRPRLLEPAPAPRSPPPAGTAADSAADLSAHLLLPAQEGSAERYLADVCGVPESQVDAVMSAAVAWRVTAGGRPLIDRRRRSRVERNIRIVERYLIDKCGVPPGKDGVGTVFQMAPAIMRCKPTVNDRWDRRVIELAAYLYRYGHCNVPEECEEMPELGAWVKRQRVARQQAGLTQERLDILLEMGFEFGEEAQMTEEWEWRFDSLVELLLMRETKVSAGELSQRSLHDWVGMEWGAFGGPAAREVALWVQLQREFRRRNLLSAPAVTRLNAIGFEWEPKGGLEWQHRWMARFARVVYLIERSKKTVQARNAQLEQEKRRQLAQQPSLPPSTGHAGQRAGQPQSADPATRARPSRPAAADLFEGLVELHTSRSSWRRTAGLAPAGVAAQRWLQQEVELRRAAFAIAKPEPGLRCWLARQQRDWRRGRLTHEQTLLLTLAGADLDLYTPAQWRAAAHEAAAYLTGCAIRPTLDNLEEQDSAARDSSSTAGQLSSVRSATVAAGTLVGTAAQLHARKRSLGSELDEAGITGKAAAATAVLQRTPDDASSDFEDLSSDGEGPADAYGPWWEDFVQVGGLPVQARARARVRGRAAPGRPPGRRLAVVRWLQTQRQLWAEQRLSQSQLRYMALLGITWILSDEVVFMRKAAWAVRLQQLAALKQREGTASVDARMHSETLHDWLEHQKALLAIDWLSLERERQLTALGVDKWPHRGAAEREWDERLTQLLAFRRQHGHLQVGSDWERAPDLAQWLRGVRAEWREGGLLSSQVAQLAALGVEPLDARGP
ncbi:g5683 [Coccomyxa elongata]